MDERERSAIDETGLADLVEQIRVDIEALRLPHDGSAVSSRVTVSIGAALCRPTSAQSSGTLVDAQLPKARRQGCNRLAITRL